MICYVGGADMVAKLLIDDKEPVLVYSRKRDGRVNDDTLEEVKTQMKDLLW